MMKVLHTLLRPEGNDKYCDHIDMNNGKSNPFADGLDNFSSFKLQTPLDAGLQYGEGDLKCETGIFIL